MVKGPDGKPHGEQLRSALSVQPGGDLIAVLQLPHEGDAGTDLFTLMTGLEEMARSCIEEGLGLISGKRFSLHRNRLPKEVVMAPSLTEFKKNLDNTLRHMV